jgi:hypothetical protein
MKDSLFGPNFVSNKQVLEEARRREAMGGQPESRIDIRSNTWIASKKYIKDKIANDYMQVLRTRNIGQDETQYARGAIDALESLLEFGGDTTA